MAIEQKTTQKRDANRDPITGEPGAHPVGAGVGAALGGAAVGAAAGMAAGPVGAAIGAVAGGFGGGLAGKAAAEKIDPTAEDAYWKANYAKRPYYSPDIGYGTYAPAYRHGWEATSRNPSRTFDEAEPELRQSWEKSPHSVNLGWDKAKLAARDAWHHVRPSASHASEAIVVGVFNDRRSADAAIDDLKSAGFWPEQVGVVALDPEGHITSKAATATKGASNATDGAVAGAVVGLGIGGLVGLGVLAGVIPVIGPAIAAGTLGTILSNAAGGAAIAGLTGALVGWGVPEEHAKYYENELKAGRIVLTVHAGDRGAEVRTIVRRHSGYDHESRATAARD